MKNLAKLLRSSAFRLMAMFLAIFAIAATALIGYIYYNTNIILARQLDASIEAEVNALADQYRDGGFTRLVAAIEQRAASPGDALYLIADARGRTLAGNVFSAPQGIAENVGWFEFIYRRYQGGETTQRLARARTFRLTEGYYLLVGRDIEERRRLERVIASAVAWGLALTIALGIVGGLLASRRMLARLDAMAATSRRIMLGNLSERIPRNGSGDELDRLAESLNAMLAQIEALMGGLKHVSDNIAHDLKTPLTRLRNRAESTLRGKKSAKDYREALEQTIEESDKLIGTFNALLSIARAEAGASGADFADLDAVAVLNDVAELYEPIAEEQGASISIDAASQITFRGNRELISRAIANLIDNALKYAAPGGTDGRKVVVGASRSADAVELFVKDNGPGIPEADRQRVVERFVRLESGVSQPGSGLGLSLVAAVARLHNGALRLQDNGPGLDARIVIPLGETR